MKFTLDHPKGLYILFFTEMWERFSYYGMRALLVLYMTKYLLLDADRTQAIIGYNTLESALGAVFGVLNIQQMSSQIYGLYTGFVYFTAFFGGLMADRFLGQSKTVYLGGILMVAGYFLMALENWFLVALLFLVIGNGCFKPNISTQVGNLYAPDDRRRDAAFLIFYMGINLGAFLAPLVCGTLGQKVGWHWGFATAGFGMLIGLLVYHLGRKHLPRDIRKQIQDLGAQESERSLTRDEWKRVGVLCLVCFLNIVFWGIFEQQGNTLQLWAEDKTRWAFFGFDLPSSLYQSLNPGFIFLFTPFLGAFWAWQASRKSEPSSIKKMGIGCFLCGAGFVFMILAALFVPGEEKGSLLWLVATTWTFTIGELYISPIGLSFVTKVAPRKIASMMMGVWFLSYFAGNYAGGLIGMYYSVLPKEVFFSIMAISGPITGILLYLVARPASKVVGASV